MAEVLLTDAQFESLRNELERNGFRLIQSATGYNIESRADRSTRDPEGRSEASPIGTLERDRSTGYWRLGTEAIGNTALQEALGCAGIKMPVQSNSGFQDYEGRYRPSNPNSGFQRDFEGRPEAPPLELNQRQLEQLRASLPQYDIPSSGYIYRRGDREHVLGTLTSGANAFGTPSFTIRSFDPVLTQDVFAAAARILGTERRETDSPPFARRY